MNGHCYCKPCVLYICWAQSVDRRYPWICLHNLWIHTLRRNPWIAQISVDRATRSMNFAYDNVGRNLWIGDIHGSACAIYGSILCAEIHGCLRNLWILRSRSTDLPVLYADLIP